MNMYTFEMCWNQLVETLPQGRSLARSRPRGSAGGHSGTQSACGANPLLHLSLSETMSALLTPSPPLTTFGVVCPSPYVISRTEHTYNA